jgi:hypothetical protein
MKICMKIDLNICHNFSIGNFDQRSIIFKRKNISVGDLNLMELELKSY